METRSDAALLKQILDGDVMAFEQLVRKYERPLLSFSYRITADWSGAEEVVQDTFFSVYQTVARIDLSKTFTTYLFEIAKNRSISWLRKRRAHVPIDDDAIIVDEQLYERLADREVAQTVRAAVSRLPVSYRRVVELYYFEDFAYGEIAKKLSLPINTVRTHLRRGKQLLAKQLFYAYKI